MQSFFSFDCKGNFTHFLKFSKLHPVLGNALVKAENCDSRLAYVFLCYKAKNFFFFKD